MFDELRTGALTGLRLGLLHGRMSADDKEVTMARFKRGEIDVLVATTVIEVGVDVPNATRHGHRARRALRPRANAPTPRTRRPRRREKLLRPAHRRTRHRPKPKPASTPWSARRTDSNSPNSTSQQRGPGEFFGTRQAGLPEFRVANLARDRDLLELAKPRSRTLRRRHPTPPSHRAEIDAVWARLKQQWQRRYGLVEA